MTSPSTRTPAGNAFEIRIARAIPLSGWVGWITLTLALTVLGLALHRLSGVMPVTMKPGVGPVINAQAHVTFLCSALLAYGLMAARWVSRSRPAGSHFSPRCWLVSRLAGATGVIFGMVIIFTTTRQINIQEPSRNPWNAGEIYVDLLSLLLLWGIGRAAYFTFRGSGMDDHRMLTVDLWDLAPLYRQAHLGLRDALAWSLGISLLVIIMFFDPNPALQVDSAKLLVPLTLATVATAALSLSLPLWTLRKRVREEKSRVIAKIDADLRESRKADSPESLRAPGREADLFARRAHVTALPEWFIDTGGLRKFGFYLVFPVASWLVGPVFRQVTDHILFSPLVRKVIDLLP